VRANSHLAIHLLLVQNTEIGELLAHLMVDPAAFGR